MYVHVQHFISVSVLSPQFTVIFAFFIRQPDSQPSRKTSVAMATQTFKAVPLLSLCIKKNRKASTTTIRRASTWKGSRCAVTWSDEVKFAATLLYGSTYLYICSCHTRTHTQTYTYKYQFMRVLAFYFHCCSSSPYFACFAASPLTHNCLLHSPVIFASCLYLACF